MKRVIVVFLAFCSLPSTALALSQPTTTFTTRVRNCAGYANYWEEHLLTEYREASNELKERRRTWSRKQLEDAGICIFGAAAMVSFIESKVVAGPHKQRICCSSLTLQSDDSPTRNYSAKRLSELRKREKQNGETSMLEVMCCS